MVEQRPTVKLEEFLRMCEMRFSQTHISQLIRELWHIWTHLATRAIDSCDVLEDTRWDLDDGNMVSVQIRAMLHAVLTNAVDVESKNACITAIPVPAPDLIEWDTHGYAPAVRASPVTAIDDVVRTLSYQWRLLWRHQ